MHCGIPNCYPSQTMKVKIDIIIKETQKIDTKLVMMLLVTIRRTINEKPMLIKMPYFAVEIRAVSVAIPVNPSEVMNIGVKPVQPSSTAKAFC